MIMVFRVEYRVQQTGETVGSRTQRSLAFAHAAAKVAGVLLQAQEFISDIQGGEHGDTQGVDRIAVGRDSTHLSVNHGCQLLNVVRIRSAQMIGLVVNIYADGRGGTPNFKT